MTKRQYPLFWVGDYSPENSSAVNKGYPISVTDTYDGSYFTLCFAKTKTAAANIVKELNQVIRNHGDDYNERRTSNT